MNFDIRNTSTERLEEIVSTKEYFLDAYVREVSRELNNRINN